MYVCHLNVKYKLFLMTIPQIKSQLSIAQVLALYHLKPDKKLRLSCPFHEDKTPSMQVYYKTQTAYCFSGNCPTHGKSLDVIDFVMHKESCTKHEALEKCKAMIDGQLVAKPMTELPRSAVLQKVFMYFSNAVSMTKAAQEYLESRKLDYKQLVTRGLTLGYNSGQMHQGKRRDEFLIKSCVDIGLMSPSVNGRRPKSGAQQYQVFGRGCLAFALRGPSTSSGSGKIEGLYFRNISEGAGRHYYLRDRRGLYPKYPAASTQKLLLTESIIDAVSLLQSDQTSVGWEVLALYGTNGFTQEHAAAVAGLDELKEVCLFLNGDAAGRKATEIVAEKIRVLKPGVLISSVSVAEGEDCNSLLVKEGAELLAHMIEERTTLPSSTEAVEHRNETTDDSNRPLRVSAAAPARRSSNGYAQDRRGDGLDVANAYDIGYRAKSSELRIKGLKVDQLDSLKVTLQIRLA